MQFIGGKEGQEGASMHKTVNVTILFVKNSSCITT